MTKEKLTLTIDEKKKKRLVELAAANNLSTSILVEDCIIFSLRDVDPVFKLKDVNEQNTVDFIRWKLGLGKGLDKYKKEKREEAE